MYKGKALSSFLTKALLKRRAPLSVEQLELLESLAAGAATSRRDQVFAGFCAFMAHTRARFGDAMAVAVEPRIDGPLLEAAVSSTKTSNRPGRRRRLLCMVGYYFFGVSGQPWAAALLASRASPALRASAAVTLTHLIPPTILCV